MKSVIVDSYETSEENLTGKLMFGKLTGHIYLMVDNTNGVIVYLGHGRSDIENGICEPYLGMHTLLEVRENIVEFSGALKISN